MSEHQEERREALETGTTVGLYRIEKRLGAGGFGITYLARDVYLDRLVALKEFMPLGTARRGEGGAVQVGHPGDAEGFRLGLERFLTEARLLGRVDHPNVVRVLSAFECNGTGYIAMAFEPGEILSARIRRQPHMSESKLRALALGLLDALDAIHGAGIIHRDLKPSNVIMARDGRPVLLDFGSATRLHGDRCDAGICTISPGYSPIELYQPERFSQGPWTDIYGVAAVLYRIIAGVRPAPPGQPERDPESAGRSIAFAAAVGAERYSDGFLAGVAKGLATVPELRHRRVESFRRALAARGLSGRRETAAAPRPAAGRLPAFDFAACRDETNGLLLTRARRLLATAPPSNKKRTAALNACRRVLSVDPTHAEAKKLMKQVAFEALVEAKAALRNGAVSAAALLLALAESVMPSDPNVGELREKLAAAEAPSNKPGADAARRSSAA